MVYYPYPVPDGMPETKHNRQEQSTFPVPAPGHGHGNALLSEF